MAKKFEHKPEIVRDAPPVEATVLPTAPANVDPIEEPKVEPEAKPVAPTLVESLCVSCERSCKSTLMRVCICGKFLPKQRP
jgi:hypothetical protein